MKNDVFFSSHGYQVLPVGEGKWKVCDNPKSQTWTVCSSLHNALNLCWEWYVDSRVYRLMSARHPDSIVYLAKLNGWPKESEIKLGYNPVDRENDL